MTHNNATTTSRPRQESPDSTLRRARLAKGISQVDLADVSGVSASWISVLDRRPRLMSRCVAEGLAGALDVRVNGAPLVIADPTVDPGTGRRRGRVCP